MYFSDALPVQWWLVECETYNENEPQGVHYVCWCQPWNCDVPILVQFTHTTGGDYSVRIIAESGEELDQEVDEVLPGVYQTTVLLSDNSPDFCHGKVKLQMINNADDSVVAKTDCLDVALEHDEVTLFEYSNERNYAGLRYEAQSPDLSLSILVPCRFYHPRETEEDNAIELTSSVVITGSEIKTQRLLEVKHAPHYFHKKLQLILKHQSVTAVNKSWKKEEKYEKAEGNNRWPLKSATAYLTETDSVVRNVM